MNPLKRLRMSCDLRCFFRGEIKPAQGYVLTRVNMLSVECETECKFSRSNMDSIIANCSRILKGGKGEHAKIESFLKWLDDSVFLHLIMTAEEFRNFKLLHEDKICKAYWHLPYLENWIAAIKARAFLVCHRFKNDVARKHYRRCLPRTVKV